jgi:electron transfer flavoprotein alpha subunit
MILVTLVKAVPDLDTMSFDPVSNTARRSDDTMFLNPFDARAALVAPTLVGPEDSSLVVSMGPAGARAPLVEAMAMSGGRGILVNDPALAGSDTWVTARVLERVLRPLAPDLVLAGRWSTDSSTGQMPAQLADRLGLALVDGARRIERTGDGTVEVVGETEEGWARYEVATPCLVTVGEKIVRMRAPSAEALEAARARSVEVRSVAALGLSAEEVGLVGSLTVVRALRNEEPHRTAQVLDTGPLPERIRAAAQRIRELRSRPREPAAAARPPPEPPAGPGEVLVFVSGADGGVDPDALPMATEVLRLPAPFHPSALGFGPLTGSDRERLLSAGVGRAYWAEGPAGWRAAESLVPAVSEVLAARTHAAGGLFLSRTWTRELAGRVSARLGLGLTGDAVTVTGEAGTGLVFGKPSFGGGLLAEVVSKKSPSLATVRPGSFPPARSDRQRASLEVLPIPLRDVPVRLRRTGSGVERELRFGNLETARVVVVVGMGVGGPDGVAEVVETVRPLGAALAATRKVVDAGWVPPQLQVGLTGRSIAPDLYLAVGVSGKANHLVGAKRANVVVGVNSRRSEPLFSRVDVGVVGDWREVLPLLVRDLVETEGRSSGG